MNPEAVLQQLYIIRAQVDLGIAILEGGAPRPDVPIVGVCPHPEDKRYDATTAGDGPHKWICGECLQTFEGAIP